MEGQLCRQSEGNGLRFGGRIHRGSPGSMITALDTNVLLDIVAGDGRFTDLSLEAVERAAAAGALVISDPVYAELSASFASQRNLDQFLDENQIAVRSLSRAALFSAGRAWK